MNSKVQVVLFTLVQSELPAEAAILTSRPWAPAASCLQAAVCRDVRADSAAAQGPDRPGPTAPGATCPGSFQAAAGAARVHGCHHRAHRLLREFPPARGLGPVTPGQLQEAGVKGAALAHSRCDLATPACPDMSAASLAGLLGIMSFSYSDLFCNHDLSIPPW